MMDSERRGEEESAPDSQDLSSAASLDRGNVMTRFDSIFYKFYLFFIFFIFYFFIFIYFFIFFSIFFFLYLSQL